MTYRLDVPAGVLSFAEEALKLARTGIAKFDSLKTVALKKVQQFAAWLRNVKAQLEAFLATVGSDITAVLANAFPKLVRSAAQRRASGSAYPMA